MENNNNRLEVALQQIHEAVYSTLNLQQILDLMVRNTTVTLAVRGCSLFILSEEGKDLKAIASHGLSQSYLSKGHIHADKSISETMQGKVVLIDDPCQDPRIQYPEGAKKEGITSILSLPLSLNSKIIGVLRVYMSEGRTLSVEEIGFVKALCESCVLAIQNACCYEVLQEKHEIMMSDVWRWFRLDPALSAYRHSGIQSLPTANLMKVD